MSRTVAPAIRAHTIEATDGGAMRVRAASRRVVAVVAAAVAAVLALSGCAAERTVKVNVPAQVGTPLPDATVGALKDAVTHAMAAAGAPGAIVGVWVPWSGTWVAGLGTQGPGGAAVTADLSFRAGDLGRPMICDVLYQVAAEGTVRLTDSVAGYVAGVPDLKNVTLRQLCDGTGGLGAFGPQLLPVWLANPGREWDPHELAAFGLGEPRTAPGVAWRDSDAGYVLLGLALERATGLSARQLLSRYVTAPLGLSSTVLGTGTLRSEARSVLAGYHSLPGADGAMQCAKPLDATDVSTTTGATDSGVVSTIADVGRYVQALASNSLLPDAAKVRWAKPLPTSTTAPSWFTTTGGAYQAGSLVGQFGAVPGYATAAFADPKTGLAVAVVLDNSGSGATIVGDLAFELAAIASKSPSAGGRAGVALGLPWTAEQYHAAIGQAAICPITAK